MDSDFYIVLQNFLVSNVSTGPIVFKAFKEIRALFILKKRRRKRQLTNIGHLFRSLSTNNQIVKELIQVRLAWKTI